MLFFKLKHNLLVGLFKRWNNTIHTKSGHTEHRKVNVVKETLVSACMHWIAPLFVFLSVGCSQNAWKSLA